MSQVVARTFKNVVIGTKMIPIAVAEYVRGNGWKRQVDCIDPRLVQSTVEKVAGAVTAAQSGLTKEQMRETAKVAVRYASTFNRTLCRSRC